MGIPRFLKDIIRPLNNRLGRKLIKKIEEIQGQRLGVLAIDMNSLLHEQAQYVYKYGEYESEYPQVQNMTADELFEQYIARIFEVVMDIHSMLPSDILVLSYDGVATLGKLNQQKTRRYRAVYNEKKPEVSIDGTETEQDENSTADVPIVDQSGSSTFNSNVLTPGTNFMIDLTERLSPLFVDAFSNSDTVLLYADTRGHGEGEQKILNSPYGLYGLMEYSKRHVIYGSDGDLILMTLAKEVPDILVYRPDVGAIDIGLMRRHVLNEGYSVDDYVFLCMLLGNDFVPATPMMEDASFSMSRLETAYKEMSRSSPTNVPYRLIDQNKKLNVDRFMDLLNRLLPAEIDSILYLSQNKLKGDFIYSNAVKVRPQATGTRTFRARTTGRTTTLSKIPSDLDTTDIEQLRKYYEVDMRLFRYLWNVNLVGFGAEFSYDPVAASPEETYYYNIFIDNADGVVPSSYELTDVNMRDAVSNYIDALMWSYRFIAYGVDSPVQPGQPFINGNYVYPYYYAPTIHDILTPTVRDEVEVVGDEPPSLAQINTRIAVMKSIGVPSLYLLTEDYYNQASLSTFKSSVIGKEVTPVLLHNPVYSPTLYHPLSVVATVIPYQVASNDDDFLDEQTARLIYKNDQLNRLGIFDTSMSLSTLGRIVDYQYVLYVTKIFAPAMQIVDTVIRNQVVTQLPQEQRISYTDQSIQILEKQ